LIVTGRIAKPKAAARLRSYGCILEFITLDPALIILGCEQGLGVVTFVI
jgi:hypothetical protein